MTVKNKLLQALLVLTFAFVFQGCSNDSATKLTIYGSKSATATASINFKGTRYSLLNIWQSMTGWLLPESYATATPLAGTNVSYVNFDFYALYMSTSTDCSNPVLVTNNGATPVSKDMAASGTTLFTGNPPDGTYKCIAIKMHDVITFRPDAFSAAAAGSQCNTATSYTFDIYRTNSGDSWKDINGAGITATGDGVTMGADQVFVFASTDAAALAAGSIAPHSNQTVSLSSALTVPGNTTFFSNFADQVTVTPTCGLDGVVFGFR
jgi:hypothetical protein